MSETHPPPQGYWTLTATLAFLTVVEWLLFLQRDAWGIGTGVLVPALLLTSAIKFLMVVGWHARVKFEPSWVKKGVVAGFVMGGGTSLLLYLLSH